MIDHRLLDRVQRAILTRQMFDRHHMAAIHRGEETDAGIDRRIGETIVGQPSDENGAGAAIAFRAALLRAGQASIKAQKVEERSIGGDIGQGDVPTVQNEPDFATMRHHRLPLVTPELREA